MAEGRTFRVGMVGCGFFAQNHLHAWSYLKQDGAVLTAVCDLDAAKAEAAGENNLKTFALVEAAYESANTHAAVKPAR